MPKPIAKSLPKLTLNKKKSISPQIQPQYYTDSNSNENESDEKQENPKIKIPKKHVPTMATNHTNYESETDAGDVVVRRQYHKKTYDLPPRENRQRDSKSTSSQYNKTKK